MIGMNRKILAWTGSGGCGFRRCWTNMESPMRIGQTPRLMSSKGPSGGTSQGSRPKPFKNELGSGAERSWIQPKKGAWRISMVTNMTL